MRTRITLLALAAILGLAVSAQAEMYNAQYLAPFAVPAAMNESGTVVGRNPVYREAFVYDDAHGYSALPCPKPYASCDAVDVNEAGWIVGRAQYPGMLNLRTAALWTPIGATTEAAASLKGLNAARGAWRRSASGAGEGSGSASSVSLGGANSGMLTTSFRRDQGTTHVRTTASPSGSTSQGPSDAGRSRVWPKARRVRLASC